jgi:hypothetical protein
MDPQTNPGEIIQGVVPGTSRIAADVLGPTVEFLTSPAAVHASTPSSRSCLTITSPYPESRSAGPSRC